MCPVRQEGRLRHLGLGFGGLELGEWRVGTNMQKYPVQTGLPRDWAFVRSAGPARRKERDSGHVPWAAGGGGGGSIFH